MPPALFKQVLQLIQPKSREFIGIDIDAAALKLLAVQANKDNFCITGFASMALPPGAVVEKEIQNPDQVTTALVKAVQTSGIKANNAAIALADSSVITRLLQVDATLSASEIVAQVYYEAEKFISHPLTEVRVDYQILGPSKLDSAKIDVMVGAARAETVDNYVNVVKSAGMIVKIVDIESYVIARACSLLTGKLSAQGIITVILLSDERSTLTILKNFQPIFTRNELFRDIRLNKDSQNLAENFEGSQLQRLKEIILQHLRRNLQFFISNTTSNNVVEKIILAGSLAKLPELAPFIQSKIGIPTLLADVLENIELSAEVSSANLTELSPSLMICCGLALRGILSND